MSKTCPPKCGPKEVIVECREDAHARQKCKNIANVRFGRLPLSLFYIGTLLDDTFSRIKCTQRKTLKVGPCTVTSLQIFFPPPFFSGSLIKHHCVVS